jgi:hypothetical protein
MRLLVTSANFRAGKTSLIYALSRLKKIKYEKIGELKGAEDMIESSESDLMVIEGGKTYKHGIAVGRGDYFINANKVLAISRFEESYLDELYIVWKIFKEKFGAAILNEVPEKDIDSVEREVERLPFELIGVIPFEPSLGGTKVSSITKLLEGRTLSSPPAEVTVDRILVGAMSPSCAVKWLENAENSALITGGDRVDLQKLALDKGVKCLILTGGLEPPKVIVRKAEEIGSVIILSDYDTLTSIEKIQKEIGKEPLDELRAEKAAEFIPKYVDFRRLFEILGVE